MDTALTLSTASLTTAGTLLLTVVAIESGGFFLLRIVRGQRPATGFQRSFFRAGHAHAGVLVTLSLICQVFVDAAAMEGPMASVARSGVPLAAILMPAGFFLSAAGRQVTAPNRFILLLYAGTVSLAAGVVALGIGLFAAL